MRRLSPLQPIRLALILASCAALGGLSACSSAPQPDLDGALSAPFEPQHLSRLQNPPWPAPSLDEERGQERLRVVIVSDLNGRYGSTIYDDAVHQAVARIVALEPDLVLSAGDMVAGQREDLDYEAMWTSFHAAVTDPITDAGIPFMVTPGNHDASGYDKFAAEREIYVEQWRSRVPEGVRFVDDEFYPLRHAFVSGPALFIAIDATMTGPLDPEQRDWAQRVLERHPNHPIKIVYGHLPLHPFAQTKTRDVIDDPEFEALLVEHDVTMYVSGHHHAYYPGRRGDLRMVGTACLGGGSRTLLGADERSERSFIVMELDAHGVHELEAYAGSDFDRVVARETLPFAVGQQTHWVVRDDVRFDARVMPWNWFGPDEAIATTDDPDAAATDDPDAVATRTVEAAQ